MKKKILLLLLCMLMIVPLFVVGASADSALGDTPVMTYYDWIRQPLTSDRSAEMKYGRYCIQWKIEELASNAPDTSNAYAGASWQNPNSVSFKGVRSVYRQEVGYECYYPMMLVVRNEEEIEGQTDFGYLYRSDCFTFEWYMNADQSLCLAVYSVEDLERKLVMMVEIGNSITLFMSEENYTFNYCYAVPIYIEFYFEMAYLNSMNVQYNPAYRGGFECFLNCFAMATPTMSVDGEVADNLVCNEVKKHWYQDGLADGLRQGLSEGYDEGFRIGRVMGREDMQETFDGVSLIVASLFEAPYRFLSSFFDVSIFGINIFSIVSTIISIAIVWFCVSMIIKVVGHFRK